tara:strand:- start:27904 stop:28206 length:303 start_codon:yes stop_codon:yes gene_type:complete
MAISSDSIRITDAYAGMYNGGRLTESGEPLADIINSVLCGAAAVEITPVSPIRLAITELLQSTGSLSDADVVRVSEQGELMLNQYLQKYIDQQHPCDEEL